MIDIAARVIASIIFMSPFIAIGLINTLYYEKIGRFFGKLNRWEDGDYGMKISIWWTWVCGVICLIISLVAIISITVGVVGSGPNSAVPKQIVITAYFKPEVKTQEVFGMVDDMYKSLHQHFDVESVAYILQPQDPNDPKPPYTPTWQITLTDVSKEAAVTAYLKSQYAKYIDKIDISTEQP